MKQRFFVVFCTKAIAEPKLYKRLAYAMKKAQLIPSYEIKSFSDEEEAQAFFKKIKKTGQTVKGERIIQSLSNNLKLETRSQNHVTKEEHQNQDQQGKKIAQDQKQLRSIWFNRLLEQNIIFRKAQFQYSKGVNIKSGLKYQGFFDGSSRGNPGDSGIGYVIKPYNRSNNIISRGAFIGRRTSNVAELISLILMMGDAYINGITHLKVFGDSKLIISFMSGEYQVRAKGLVGYVEAARSLSQKFQGINFAYIGRSYNFEADDLARNASNRISKKQ